MNLNRKPNSSDRDYFVHCIQNSVTDLAQQYDLIYQYDLAVSKADGMEHRVFAEAPSLERIAEVHTQITYGRVAAPRGHQGYSQGEQCYICTLLAVIEDLKTKLADKE